MRIRLKLSQSGPMAIDALPGDGHLGALASQMLLADAQQASQDGGHPAFQAGDVVLLLGQLQLQACQGVLRFPDLLFGGFPQPPQVVSAVLSGGRDTQPRVEFW
ncbi:hypothetical protein ABZU32_31470 [Sphaerisporangium sp. NPDC005288]|uniref:hypothetical protein n=1 Tax=Sphaerisporangium sp. NPDC005288 TaxID=3155114 RepID=UPI0033B19395